MDTQSCTSRIKRSAAAALCGLWITLVAGPAAVQAQASPDGAPRTPNIGVFHNPPHDGASLPPPGYPIQISAQLFNTKDTTMPVKTFATIDGRLIELAPSTSYLNKDDYPEYVINTHAPLVSLSYYFVAYPPDGPVARSETFTLQRSCIPSVAPISAELVSDARDGQARLEEIVHKAWALERELNAYEHVKTLLESIQDELNRLDGRS